MRRQAATKGVLCRYFGTLNLHSTGKDPGEGEAPPNQDQTAAADPWQYLTAALVAAEFPLPKPVVNRDLDEWYPIFLDDLLASAAMDRLLHHAHTLVIEGDSYRNPPAKKRA